MAYGPSANAPGPGEPEGAESGDMDRPGEDEAQTAFVPMDLFPKPPAIGDTCTFKVKDVSQDGDVELEYLSSSSEKKAPSGPVAPWDQPDEGETEA